MILPIARHTFLSQNGRQSFQPCLIHANLCDIPVGLHRGTIASMQVSPTAGSVTTDEKKKTLVWDIGICQQRT